MFDCFDNRVTLSGTLTAQTALRIGAGRATEVVGTDLPVVRDALGYPYIPGSSLKGTLRSFVEALVRGVKDDTAFACKPTSNNKQDDWCLPSAEGMEDDAIEQRLCLVCRVFGSPWWASKVSISDLLVDEKIWFGQFEERNGVAIDRDTETAADQKLYDFEVVPAGTRFKCEIIVENAAQWELGLLMLGLRAFERGEMAMGGARSRGLGVVKLDWEKRQQIKGGEGLLDYLAGDGGVADLNDEIIKTWAGSFRAELKRRITPQEEPPNA